MKKFLCNLFLPTKIVAVLFTILYWVSFNEPIEGVTISALAGYLLWFLLMLVGLIVAMQLLTVLIKWLINLFRKLHNPQMQERAKEFIKTAVKPTSQKKAEIQAESEKLQTEREALSATREELQRDLANSKAQQSKLMAYSADLSAKEAETKRNIEEMTSKAKKEISSERRKVDERLDELHQYEAALHRTEYQVLNWIKLKENNDIAYFDEMQTMYEKYKTFSDQVPEMDGFQFEEYIGKILIANGYIDVEVTQKTQDFGADVVATFGNAKYVFQCKYYTHPVGIDAVQQIYSAKSHYAAHVAVVVTNSVFTKAARILADEIGVLLWDGETISNMAQHI